MHVKMCINNLYILIIYVLIIYVLIIYVFKQFIKNNIFINAFY